MSDSDSDSDYYADSVDGETEGDRDYYVCYETEESDPIALGLSKEEIEEMRHATDTVYIEMKRERFNGTYCKERGNNWIMLPSTEIFKYPIGTKIPISLYMMKIFISSDERPKEIEFLHLVDKD